MAYQHRLGTFDQPIDILDSDEESHATGVLSFVDLTQDDIVLAPNPPALQQTPIKGNGPSTADPGFHGRQPSELVPQPSLYKKGHISPLTFKNENKISLISSPSILRSFRNIENRSTEHSPQFSSDDGADSEFPDIMDRSIRRRLRGEQEGTSNDNLLNLQARRNIMARTILFESASANGHGAQDGEIRRRVRVQRHL
jgi:hypothetical protein